MQIYILNQYLTLNFLTQKTARLMSVYCDTYAWVSLLIENADNFLPNPLFLRLIPLVFLVLTNWRKLLNKKNYRMEFTGSVEKSYKNKRSLIKSISWIHFGYIMTALHNCLKKYKLNFLPVYMVTLFLKNKREDILVLVISRGIFLEGWKLTKIKIWNCFFQNILKIFHEFLIALY